MKICIKCGSHAFNLYAEEIDQGGLCDVHYWQGRAHRAEAQPEQEPVAWTVVGNGKFGKVEIGQHAETDLDACSYWVNRGYSLVPLYTTPPKRPWVGLTDEETKEQIKHSDLLDMFEHIGWYSAPRKGFDKNAILLIQAIEAKLKELNT